MQKQMQNAKSELNFAPLIKEIVMEKEELPMMQGKYRVKTYMIDDRSMAVDGISGPHETMTAENAAIIRAKLARKCTARNSWIAKYKFLYFPYAVWQYRTKGESDSANKEDLMINGKYSMEKGEVISCRWLLFKAVYKVKSGNFVYQIEDSIWSYVYNKKAGIKKGAPVYVVILGDGYGYEIVPEKEECRKF